MKNAHQWEKEDLLNVGINPLLTATGGSGASASGVTSAPSVQKAETPDMSKIVSNAIEAKNLKNNTKLTNAQVGKLSAEEENVKADTVNKQLDNDYKRIENSSLPKQIKAKIENMYADSKLKSFLSSAKQADKLQSEIDKNRAEEKYKKGETALLGKEKKATTSQGHDWKILNLFGAGKNTSYSYERY